MATGTTKENVSLLSKFQGAILGAIFGDCFGEKFENAWRIMSCDRSIRYYEYVKEQVEKSKDSSNDPAKKGFVMYTDDSAMTFDLGESLVKNKEFLPQDVAKSFCETYSKCSHRRQYGPGVGFVFGKLRASNYQNPFEPAKEQFDGSGSYGNGSAMRVSSVPLFHHKDGKKIANLAAKQSKLTHSNPLGINGAILQALAIEKAMTSENIDDSVKFARELFEDLTKHTPVKTGLDDYKDKMEIVVKLLQRENEVTGEDIEEADILTDVTAQEAVPAAIFSFLYTLNPDSVPSLSKYNGLVRSVLYAAAVSLDSDTVASMAGAIAGAYYGIEMITEEWVEACEGSERALKLADGLYRLYTDRSEGTDPKGDGCNLN